MKILLKMMMVVSGLVLVGCGGGGGTSSTEAISVGGSSSSEVYKNNVLPIIKDDTIPEALLDKKTQTVQKNNKIYYKETSISNGFINLKERMGYFYFKQMEMNINLSYLDSV